MMMLARFVVLPRKPTATTARIDAATAAIPIEIRVATASGTSPTKRNVKRPPSTTNTPWAKFTIPVVR